jgi:hypothetical protein
VKEGEGKRGGERGFWSRKNGGVEEREERGRRRWRKMWQRGVIAERVERVQLH